MSTRTDRQNDFLRAAIDIVSRNGFSKLTIRNVASAVGVTEPAVYRHFPTKLALLEAMLEELQSALLPHFYRLKRGSSSPRRTFEEFIKGLFEEFRIRPAYAPFIFSEEIFHNEAQLKKKLQEVMSENIRVLTWAFGEWQQNESCRTDIPPQEIALLTLASIRLSVSRWHISEGELGLAGLAESIVSTLTTLFNLKGGKDA